jgi:hypothetical protein
MLLNVIANLIININSNSNTSAAFITHKKNMYIILSAQSDCDLGTTLFRSAYDKSIAKLTP